MSHNASKNMSVSIEYYDGKFSIAFTSSEDLTINEIQEIIFGLFKIAKINKQMTIEEFISFTDALEIYLYSNDRWYEKIIKCS